MYKVNYLFNYSLIDIIINYNINLESQKKIENLSTGKKLLIKDTKKGNILIIKIK